MLDDFHDSCGVVTSETFVAIGQRSVNQTNAVLLHRRQILKTQFLRGNLKGAMRHIHTNDFHEGPVFQELAQKVTLTTAKVEYTLRTAATKCCNDSSHALFGQANRLLYGLLFTRVSFR